MLKKIACLLCMLTVILMLLPGKINLVNAMVVGDEITVDTPDGMVFDITDNPQDFVESYGNTLDAQVGDRFIWLYKTSATAAYSHAVYEFKMIDKGGYMGLGIVDVTTEYNLNLSDYAHVHGYLQQAGALHMAGYYFSCPLTKVNSKTEEFTDVAEYYIMPSTTAIGEQLLPNATSGTRIVTHCSDSDYYYVYYDGSSWVNDDDCDTVENLIDYGQDHDVYVVGKCMSTITEINFTQFPTEIIYSGGNQEAVLSGDECTILYQGAVRTDNDEPYYYFTVMRANEGYRVNAKSGLSLYGKDVTATINGGIGKTYELNDYGVVVVKTAIKYVYGNITVPEFKAGDILIISCLENVRTVLGRIELTIDIPECIPDNEADFAEIIELDAKQYDVNGNELVSFNLGRAKECNVGWTMHFDADADINKTLETDANDQLELITINGIVWISVDEYINKLALAYIKTGNNKYTFNPDNKYYAYAYEGFGDDYLFECTESTEMFVNGEKDTLPFMDALISNNYYVNIFTLGRSDADGKLHSPKLVKEDAGDCAVSTKGIAEATYYVAKTENTCIHIGNIANADLIDEDDNPANGYSSMIVKQGTKTLTLGTDYTVDNDKVKITLTKTYLDQLTVGDYEFTITMADTIKTYSFKAQIKIEEREPLEMVEQDDEDCEVKANGDGFGRYAKAKTEATCVHITGIELDDVVDDDDDSSNGYSGIVVKYGDEILTYGVGYAIEEGSVKIILTKAYLDTLPVGTNTIDISITDDLNTHLFKLNVEIYETPVANTGDITTAYTLAQVISALALIIAAGFSLSRKKQNQ